MDRVDVWASEAWAVAVGRLTLPAALGEGLTRAAFGQGEVIAFGKRVFLFLAALALVPIILLPEGQTTIGDYVELDGRERGATARMTARAAVPEASDGKWIVVLNEDFVTSPVVNNSDQGSAHRCKTALRALPFVLRSPDGPDCQQRGFGQSSVDFAVEHWVDGIDDGKNKYASPVLFAIWNARKDAGIERPYPHRAVDLRTAPVG